MTDATAADAGRAEGRAAADTGPRPSPHGARASAAEPTRAPVPSATVAVVRDAPEGVEVLLQERALASDFVGGAWVFPGGKVDPRDGDMEPERLGPHDLRRVHGVFGATVGSAGMASTRALLVAAVRETYEEAGVLLARRDGRPVEARDLEDDAFVATRRALADRSSDHDWRPFLAEHDLVLDLDALVPLAWFVTPHGVHRRFSTRFFAAVVPEEQAHPRHDDSRHDDVEMTGTVWTTPSEALRAAEAGERQIIYPTRVVLSALAELDRADDVRSRSVAGDFDLRPIAPLVRRRDGRTWVQHPDGHPPERI